MKLYLSTSLLVLALALSGQAQTTTSNSPDPTLSRDELKKATSDAFVFGYPLVLMDVSREVMTSSSKNGAPINHFKHLREFPNAKFTDVVSPNADTLYSSAWLDLTAEPMVLSLPDSGGRYYVMEMLDAWTNVFASPGPRTTGTKRGDYAIVGPDWKGELPRGVKEIRAPTNLVWILGRTQTNGKSDYAAVHAMQDKYVLKPLSEFKGGPAKPAVATTPSEATRKGASPVDQVEQMDATAFFNRLAKLLPANPPAPADKPAMENLKKLGVVPGQTFTATGPQRTAMTLTMREATEKLSAAADSKKDLVNGWLMDTDLGTYGTNYELRAMVALLGLGANLSADAVYPRATVDGDGKQLNGKNRYVLHFDKDEIPKVKAFWSLTMYNDKQFFVANALDRYAIGDRDKLVFNPDGSLDLYIQSTPPAKGKEANWLPAPQGDFNVMLRMYWPDKEIVDGNWKPPPVKRVEGSGA